MHIYHVLMLQVLLLKNKKKAFHKIQNKSFCDIKCMYWRAKSEVVAFFSSYLCQYSIDKIKSNQNIISRICEQNIYVP